MLFTNSDFCNSAETYLDNLKNCFTKNILKDVEELAASLKSAWSDGRKIFLCGNGGSAGNAIHIANDLIYGAGACGGDPILPGLRIESLPANSAVITCLGNDIGYENIFSYQLKVKAEKNDILIVLSGSGNSKNIINALTTSKSLGMKSFALLAYDGGACKNLADKPIHFETFDMQIAEDAQLIVGHFCMKWLSSNKPKKLSF
tara:strand:- start:151 stop:759 length:609 start_codon:yes stop_codon:yes gene_type:complete